MKYSFCKALKKVNCIKVAQSIFTPFNYFHLRKHALHIQLMLLPCRRTQVFFPLFLLNVTVYSKLYTKAHTYKLLPQYIMTGCLFKIWSVIHNLQVHRILPCYSGMEFFRNASLKQYRSSLFPKNRFREEKKKKVKLK